MATVDEQITAIENEIKYISEHGQEVSDEHHKLKLARLADLEKTLSRLKSEKIGKRSLQSRMNSIIPYRG